MSTLATTIGRGVTGSRPAASEAGRLYYDTTANIFYRDNGSSWDSVSASALTNPMTTGGDTIYGGASGTPTRLANGSSGQVLTSAGGTAAPTWATPASGATTISEAFLGADASIASTNTFVDGPSLSLLAGTYFLIGRVMVHPIGGGMDITVRLWDGSTVTDEAEQFAAGDSHNQNIAVSGTVVLGSTTTIKVSVAISAQTGTIKKTTLHNATTGKASHLVALKVA